LGKGARALLPALIDEAAEPREPQKRTRLTADLVTGKPDVREAAAKLPEPAAEGALEEELLEETEPEETE